jgi:hypothetical protein
MANTDRIEFRGVEIEIVPLSGGLTGRYSATIIAPNGQSHTIAEEFTDANAAKRQAMAFVMHYQTRPGPPPVENIIRREPSE